MEAPENLLRPIVSKQEQIDDALRALKAPLPPWFVRISASTLCFPTPEDSTIALKAALDENDKAGHFDAVSVLEQWDDLPDAAVRALLQVIQATDATTREAVEQALLAASLPTPRTTQHLIIELNRQEHSLRCAALFALAKQNPQSETIAQALLASLQDPDWPVRITAAQIQLKPDGAVGPAMEVIIAALASIDEDAQSHAISVLDHVPLWSGNILQAVLDALNHLTGKAHHLVTTVLENQVALPDEAIPVLWSALQDNTASIRHTAADVLASQDTHTETTIQLLHSGLNHNDSKVRCSLAIGLLRSERYRSEAVQILLSLLSDPNEDVRSRSANVLSNIDPLDETALQMLYEALSHPDSDVRFSAAEALLKSDRYANVAVQMYCDSLRDSDDFVCRRGAQALLALGQHTEEAAQALLGQLSSPNTYIRHTALQVLLSVSPPMQVTLDAFRHSLHDRSPLVRLTAAQALLNSEPDQEGVVTVLLALLKIDAPSVEDSPEQRFRKMSLRSQAEQLLQRLSTLSEEGRRLLLNALPQASPPVRATVMGILHQTEKDTE